MKLTNFEQWILIGLLMKRVLRKKTCGSYSYEIPEYEKYNKLSKHVPSVFIDTLIELELLQAIGNTSIVHLTTKGYLAAQKLLDQVDGTVFDPPLDVKVAVREAYDKK